MGFFTFGIFSILILALYIAGAAVGIYIIYLIVKFLRLKIKEMEEKR